MSEANGEPVIGRQDDTEDELFILSVKVDGELPVLGNC